MIHHHEDETLATGNTETEALKPHCCKNTNSATYIIGASILVGSILICASIFYNVKYALKHSSGAATGNAVAAAQAQQPSAVAAQPSQAAKPVNISIKDNAPFLGNKDAAVTVIEFADYQCPYCEKWYSTIMPSLKSQYINTGKIKFIYQDFAFLGPDSTTAAQAAQCAAEQGKFWQYHDYLFTHQGAEGSGWASADHQKEFARAVGLNTSQFNQCLDSGKYAKAVQDTNSADASYGVSGTPAVIVLKGKNLSVDGAYIQTQLQNRQSIINLTNGNVFISGVQPFSVFQQAIDAALK